jgi:hypothetical protein
VGSVVVQNNAGFILNVGWEGRINQTKPTLRFRGRGELAVLSPTGNASITNLAYEAYRGLIGAIIQATSNLQNATAAPVDFESAQEAIDNAIASLRVQVQTSSGTDATYDEADVVPVAVNGTRRFF